MIWLFLVFEGYQGMQVAVAQHIRGYPSAGTFNVYVVFPSIGATAVVLSAVCFWFGRLKVFARIVQVLSLVAVLPYLLLYTGGV